MRSLVLTVLTLFASLCTSNALFEHQAGQNDWLKRYMGAPSSVILPEKSTDPVFAYSSKTKAFASLNQENGEIIWRKVVADKDAISSNYVGHDFNFLTKDFQNVFLLFFQPLELVFADPNASILGSLFVRSYDQASGLLRWDIELDIFEDEEVRQFTSTDKILAILTTKRLIIVNPKNGKPINIEYISEKIKGVRNLISSNGNLVITGAKNIVTFDLTKKSIIDQVELTPDQKQYKRSVTAVQSAEGDKIIFYSIAGFDQHIQTDTTPLSKTTTSSIQNQDVDFVHFSPNKITIFQSKNAQEYHINGNFAPETVFFSKSTLCAVLDDNTVVYISLNTMKNSASVSFTREEALADVVKAVSFDIRQHKENKDDIQALLTLEARLKDQYTNLITSSSTSSNFGFEKVFVLLTKPGKVFGLKAETGDILYSFNVGGAKDIFSDVKQHTFSVVDYNGFTVYDSETGAEVLPRAELETDYQLANNEEGVYFSIDEACRSFLVYHSKKEVLKLVVPEGYAIIGAKSHEGDLMSMIGSKTAKGGVLLKHAGYNLVSIGSRNEITGEFLIQVVDVMQGKIIVSFTEISCESFNSILFENKMIYTCFNDADLRTEITSVAFFSEQQLAKYDLNLFKSFTKKDVPIISFQKSFYLNQRVRDISITQTLRGINAKRIVFTLATGQLLAYDYRLLDPQRPDKGDPSKELPAYTPQLPIVSQSILNYHQKLAPSHGILSVPTKLESTTLILAYGLDIFFTKFQPTTGFDMLPEDFNTELLVAVCAGLTVGAVFANHALNAKRLKDAWK